MDLIELFQPSKFLGTTIDGYDVFQISENTYKKIKPNFDIIVDNDLPFFWQHTSPHIWDIDNDYIKGRIEPGDDGFYQFKGILKDKKHSILKETDVEFQILAEKIEKRIIF